MGRRTVLLIAAIVVAALGTTLIFAYVSRTDERALKDQRPVDVLVAKTLIKAGTTGAAATRAGSFRLQKVPEYARIEGALVAAGDIADLIAVSDIFPGEQIIEAKFVKAGSSGALPIPTTNIAISVQMGDPQRVAGFVRPGSEIAIFVTIKPPRLPGEPPATGVQTRVLLPRVSVLAIGPTTLKPATGTDANKESVPTAILTLSVSQAQAQKIIYTQQGPENGAMYFALLTKDSKVVPGPGVDINNLFVQ